MAGNIPGLGKLDSFLQKEIEKTGDPVDGDTLTTAEAVMQLTRVVAVLGSHTVDALYEIANQIERTRSSL